MGLEDLNRPVTFEIHTLDDSSCWRMSRFASTMFGDPSYQRQGAIWTRRQKQVFIDSLLNGFDIPKIYLHEGGDERDGKRYAIVDGKQRLEALNDFYSGTVPLAGDFRLFNSARIEELEVTREQLDALPGSTYAEVERDVPALMKYLDQRKLEVKVVRTEDVDVIEELFWRLNEAATLNGPEHRRGIGGQGIEAIDKIVAHAFFSRLPFTDRRYRHQDLAAKFILWSAPVRLRRAAGSRSEVPDTKRQNLDRMVRAVHAQSGREAIGLIAALDEAVNKAESVLNLLGPEYSEHDKVLARLGTVAVVFLQGLRFVDGLSLAKRVVRSDDLQDLELFRASVAARFQDEDVMPLGAVVLNDYGTLAQSSNDGAALARRVEILECYVRAIDEGRDPLEELAKL